MRLNFTHSQSMNLTQLQPRASRPAHFGRSI
jgi:hypothetical protein